MKNKKKVIINSLPMFLQIVLGVLAFIFLIISYFIFKVFIICKILVGVLMFIIAYNNQKIYKRKLMTIVYTIIGIIIIASLFA